MTHPDWHARFEALLNRTPHDAAGLGKTARREATTSAGAPLAPHEASETPADGPRVLGGRAGWRHVGGCVFWLLVVPGAWVAFVVACVGRMT